MSKNSQILLEHIIESISLIETHLGKMTKEDFLKSVKTQDAVLRRLEIIGEAANQLPEVFTVQHPNIAWHKITGMRNIIAHEYFAVDLELVWNTATKHLSELKKQLENIKQ